jgi:DNA invertase Pin-like site-specific DNA recombinase
MGEQQEHRVFGYARVSSKDQNLDRQLESLSKYVAERDIFQEKASGKDLNRPELQTLLNHALRAGDTLYVCSLDRLGRNKDEIKQVLSDLRAKKVRVRVLDLPTTMTEVTDEVTAATMDMINNLLIEVLGYVAERERAYIKKRQQEGIAVARKKGTKFGRKAIPLPASWQEDMQMWRNNQCTAKSLFTKYGWSSNTFYRKVNEWKRGNTARTCLSP